MSTRTGSSDSNDAATAAASASSASSAESVPPSTAVTSTASSASALAGGSAAAPKYSKRKKFEYQGRTIYEWEQDIENVDIWITPPPGVTAKMIDCNIAPDHLKLGINGNPPFIDEDFYDTVVVSESFWMIEDGELHINLQKSTLAETWPCVLKGHAALNQVEREQEQQKIMLERFQREHPGFDFSGASFSGQVPDPKSFMGGIDTSKIKGR